MSNRARRSVAKPIRLRSTGSGKLSVDEGSGIIRGCAVLSIGATIGHGFHVDEIMLRQALDSIEASGGVRVHLGHNRAPDGDGIASRVGVLKNPRIERGVLRGDLHLSKAASVSPMGDMRSYLLALADESPDLFGLSIEFVPADFETKNGQRFGRIETITACDVVGSPGANHRGLLAEGHNPMNEEQFKALLAALGLPEDATPEDAIAAASETPAEPAPEPDPTLSAKGATSVALAERTRIQQINGVSNTFKLGASWAQDRINRGVSLGVAKSDALAAMGERYATHNVTGGGTMAIGEDQNRATLAAGMSDALSIRLGCKVAKPHPRAREFQGRRLHELARICLNEAGIDTAGLSATSLIEAALSRKNRIKLAQSTGDFTAILGDSFEKSLRDGYTEAQPSWERWARAKLDIRDFKPVHRSTMGALPTPPAVDEGAGLSYVNLGDSETVYSMREYKQGLRLTWRAIINDDLNAFADNMRKLGNACRRVEDDLAYAAFIDNPTMSEDSVALFHATHSNLIASGGAAPSVATIAATSALLGLQKSGTAVLNLEPKVLLCPIALSITAQQVVSSAVDPAKSNDTVNPYAGKLEVVANARLDADSSTAWYLFAAPSDVDTVEVGFLEGRREPELSQETDWDTDDELFKSRHCVVAAAIDYRGMTKNPGT